MHRPSIVDTATVLAATCAVIVAGLVVHDRLWSKEAVSSAAATSSAREVKDWEVYARDGHRSGPADAVVTVVEFSDFECPVCRSFSKLKRTFQAAHPDVAFVFRHWPLEFHRFAYPAARAAECAAEQGAFDAFRDILFSKQDSLGLLPFKAMASRVGVLDIKRFDSCIADPRPVAAVERDVAAAKKLGGSGTPTLLVNSTLLPGLPDSARFDELIQQARRESGKIGQ